MENLAKAVLAVMKEVKGIEKSMTVGDGKYSYKGVPDQQVKKVIGDSMVKNGLTILPVKVNPTTSVSRWTEKYNNNEKQKQSVFTEVSTEYLLLHESGESQVIVGYGHGVDAQDKSAGKATTYALKYALLYTFMVPTGDIDDSDVTHSENITIPAEIEWLTEEQFQKALNSGIKGINATITHFSQAGRGIKENQKTALERKLNDLKIQAAEILKNQ